MKKMTWIPNEFDSYEQFQERHNADLASLDDRRLWREGRRSLRALEEMDERNHAACNYHMKRLRQIREIQTLRRRR
jgi:hypothetical protein